ncbi:MAG: hypothetical protein ABIR58_04890 [Gemmatimonadaceae bacterium]
MTLKKLARRIEPQAGWGDLVLPPAQIAALREIATQARNQASVQLAEGSSGRGTRELNLDLHGIDLPAVVSKYPVAACGIVRRVEAARAGSPRF